MSSSPGMMSVDSVGEEKRQVHLLGFMGSGKSTVAARLARILVWNYLDLDALIVRHVGRSIAQIFADGGEPEFRRNEAFVLRQAVQKPRTVLALGGGTTLDAANRLLSETVAVTVWLDCPLEVLHRRLGPAAAGERPLWSNPADLSALYAERRPTYAEAALRVDASADADAVALRIATALGVDVGGPGGAAS